MPLIDVETFRADLRAKRKPEGTLYRVSTGEARALGDGSRAVRFCFSDGSVDRMKDTIDPAGWETHEFMRNPVALWAHDSSAPPIGRAGNLMVEDARLMGDITFIPPETYDFADLIYRLVVGKWLNAVSVGFLPIDYKFADDEDGREWGIDFQRQSLLEISVCPVPANSNALAEARRKGVDTRPLVTWAERMLDGGGKSIVSTKELSWLRMAAKESPMSQTRGKPRQRADGMAEGDPAAGGAAVGNCGLAADATCGMIDPQQCTVHRDMDDGGEDAAAKALAATIRREVAAALKAARPQGRKAAGDADPPQPEAGRPDLSEDQENGIRMAHMHMKAMQCALDIAGDHFDNAMDALDDVKNALDATPPSDDGLAGGDDPEAEKAVRVRRARELRRLHAV
jgi:HK97 family phage prohead protease